MILFFHPSVPACSSVPRDRRRKTDTHTCGTAGLFTLCPAYIKHALLLLLEQKGKQCHQVKFLRIPQTHHRIDISPYQIRKKKRWQKTQLSSQLSFILFMQLHFDLNPTTCLRKGALQNLNSWMEVPFKSKLQYQTREHLPLEWETIRRETNMMLSWLNAQNPVWGAKGEQRE